MLGLRYGDQIAIDDPAASERTRAAVADLAAAKGLIVSKQPPLARPRWSRARCASR
jgi:pilus assembly protein CpaD